jgi:hypothetical protein
MNQLFIRLFFSKLMIYSFFAKIMKNENDISVYNLFLLNNVLIIIGYFIHDKINFL